MRTSGRTPISYLGAVLLLITITRQVPAQQRNGASARDRDLTKELARAEKKGPFATFLPLEYLAEFHREQKDWTKANDYLGRLVALWKASAGEEAVGTARFEDEEGEILAQLGDNGKAEDLLLHASSVLQQSPNVDLVARAVAMADLGAVCVQERKTADVDRLFAFALPQLEQSIGLHKPWISAASQYSIFLKDNGRNQDALDLNTRIKKAQSQDEYMESVAFVRPKPKNLQSPQYTTEAKRLRVSGTVVLYIEVSTSGHVSHVSVLRPLGLGLDEEAVRVVSTWTFVPARLGGTEVPYFGEVEVQFNNARN